MACEGYVGGRCPWAYLPPIHLSCLHALRGCTASSPYRYASISQNRTPDETPASLDDNPLSKKLSSEVCTDSRSRCPYTHGTGSGCNRISQRLAWEPPSPGVPCPACSLASPVLLDTTLSQHNTLALLCFSSYSRTKPHRIRPVMLSGT